MKYALLVTASFLMFGCSRNLLKSKSSETYKMDSASHFVDTTKTVTENTVTKSTYYGDTLTGNIFFPSLLPNRGVENDTAYSFMIFDSLESNGIKIRVGLMPVSGGFKAHVNAISKPVQVHETATNKTITHAGVSKSTVTAVATTSKQSNKQVKSFNLTGFIIILVFLGLYVALVLFAIKKFKNGQ